MEQVYEFFNKLFDTEDWPPRWICGRWTDFHGWLYIFSDLAIWAAYFAIPFFLIQFVTKKRGVPLPAVFWYFGAFILFCGLTHLVDASMFWWPAYRVNALVRFFTACISWVTVFSLVKVLPQALLLKTSFEFERELRERKRVEKKLNEYTHQLELKNKDMEQFTYIASHDLKEPLRTVSNYVTAIKEDHGPQLNEEVNKYLDSVLRATNRMNILIKELLDFSQLGQNKTLAEVDCRKLLDDVIADLKDIKDSSGATIVIGKMPLVMGYETELRQLFQNLISNAIKFQRKGTAPHIEIHAVKNNEVWEFSVKDNGIGIAPEFKDRIFTMFQRLHTRNEYEGNGIGLAHCQKIVDLHHGLIWMESTPGVGTTFYFTLGIRSQ